MPVLSLDALDAFDSQSSHDPPIEPPPPVPRVLTQSPKRRTVQEAKQEKEKEEKEKNQILKKQNLEKTKKQKKRKKIITTTIALEEISFILLDINRPIPNDDNEDPLHDMNGLNHRREAKQPKQPQPFHTVEVLTYSLLTQQYYELARFKILRSNIRLGKYKKRMEERASRIWKAL